MTMTAPARPVPAEHFAQAFTAVVDSVGRAIKGKREVVEAALVCLLAEGHLLVEDVPGVGKTSIARALAASLGVPSGRIQFTPDLLPSDVTGVSIYDQATGVFEFRPGPVFSSIVVADEINRASPKTQAALLEVMEERHVTVDGVAHDVPRPFMVLATQNPVEMDGTYPLPEAQLDRFTMRISVGYPGHAAEMEVLRAHREGRTAVGASALTSPSAVGEMIEAARRVHVGDPLYDYIVRLIAGTRALPGVRLGASPRAGIALLRVAQARAAAAGRDYATPQDVKALAESVLAHRVLLTAEAQVGGRTSREAVRAVLASTPVPDGS
ncbi:AAA family ATPase [Actinoallomurus rhizosphaericola]|uniref:AAA family ATPase n=1 Tax=Actinoallomurus rhizosphaericola TaxID=2952536 RepID=UPI002092D800|nr:MoxR family ATPase [Actinoallomurus rhizosphaericola]MCO5995348.1 MoxR family ATPase [Actinoallomurus rhizosphaericola]